MHLELTADEVAMLRNLVEERIEDLGPEIHHTRSPDYHETLKQLRDKLKALHQHLTVPSP